MKLFDYVFPASRVLKQARFFLMLLFSMCLISFSGIVSYVSAQSNEVCRETQKVLEQYEREKMEATYNKEVKGDEDYFRQGLSELNRAISNRNKISDLSISAFATHMRLQLPKEIAKMSFEEKLAFQKEIRSALEKQLQEVSDKTLEDIEQQILNLDQQIQIRQQRLKDLNCSEVLKGLNENEILLSGTWKGLNYIYQFTQNANAFKWKITNDDTYGESATGEIFSGNEIKAVWTNKNGTDSAKGTLIIKDGKVTQIEWKNGVTFYKQN